MGEVMAVIMSMVVAAVAVQEVILVTEEPEETIRQPAGLPVIQVAAEAAEAAGLEDVGHFTCLVEAEELVF
jgi:hypothetical protein